MILGMVVVVIGVIVLGEKAGGHQPAAAGRNPVLWARQGDGPAHRAALAKSRKVAWWVQRLRPVVQIRQ